ncbi:DUF484 family protein [Chitinimonas sp. BJB300]|uniref:DUF484 family protein n=1 Tax=Chitinimonas sp. BJB300 TaxID=1559339 RepID=UPI000C1081DB|nr:DUF484 family protein [Chitinimonas sp. BJB300]PHV12366.1 hypothetical protein CSQ89_06085 [Chitinimonas sp. BJB300]TSJ91075.1 DUF484 family protein [Chitinimonas sp. BJB300]
MPIQSPDVATWLKANPNFFEEYADLVAEIFIPHPHGGRAIPIAERQILTLREKNKLIENKLAELLQFGEENDQIGDKVHQLSMALLQARDLSGVLATLNYHLQEHFRVPHVAVRLWGSEVDETLSEFAQVSHEVQQLAHSLGMPYCGPYVTDEVSAWLGESSARLKSFAQVALKTDDAPFGLLVLACEDAQRFYPEMGTLYLARIGELASAALARCLD